MAMGVKERAAEGTAVTDTGAAYRQPRSARSAAAAVGGPAGRVRSNVAADIRAPNRVFGFFTITAGIDVLGVRFAAAGHPLAAEDRRALLISNNNFRIK
jgi:hypothetical protein